MIQTLDDDSIHLPCGHAFQKSFQRRPIDGPPCVGGLDRVAVLIRLTPSESAGCVRSTVSSEWLYVFKPTVAETVLYVKVVLRSDCVVVSFHRDESDEEAS